MDEKEEEVTTIDEVLEGAKLPQPRRDSIYVKRFEASSTSEGGILLPDIAKKRPLQGIVVAVGPGRLNETLTRIPVDINAGQIVLFAQYAGTELDIVQEDGTSIEILMLEEAQILGVWK